MTKTELARYAEKYRAAKKEHDRYRKQDHRWSYWVGSALELAEAYLLYEEAQKEEVDNEHA